MMVSEFTELPHLHAQAQPFLYQKPIKKKPLSAKIEGCCKHLHSRTVSSNTLTKDASSMG